MLKIAVHNVGFTALGRLLITTILIYVSAFKNGEGGCEMMLTVRKWFCFALAIAVLASVVMIPAPVAQAAAGEAAAAGAAPATVYSYQPSAKYAASTNYSLKANGVDIPVVKGFSDYDYASFSVSDGPVTYELTILNTDKVHEYSISPKKLGITPDSVVGRTITFTTQKDEYLIIMMNNRATRMVIAADPAETDVRMPPAWAYIM